MLLAMILMTLVGTVVYKLLTSTQRLSTAQTERMLLQSGMRTGALVVPAELREVAINSAGQSDLIAIAADSVAYRASRGVGFTCAVTATQVKILNTALVPFNGLRAITPGRDSLLLFVDNDTTTITDDIWVRLPILSVSTSTCGADAAIAVNTPDFLAKLPGGLLSTVKVGGPIRTEEVMVLKSYTSGGSDWVGAASLTAGDPVEPILGPIVPGGFVLNYFKGDGTVAATPAAVRVIQLTLIGETERAVASGGISGDNVIVQDTLVTSVLLRNAPR
jgi:hypothetical protein